MDWLNEKTTAVMDGAMGTMLQAAGLAPGERPDEWNLAHPRRVQAVHEAYLAAGSRWIAANTFGANAKKLAGSGRSVQEVVRAGVACAKRAAQGVAGARVLLDVGPLGEMLAPAGTLDFEEACALFAEVMRAGQEAGADGVLIETMTDLAELRAALLAAKENTRLPVLASMSFEASGRTFTGTLVESFAMTAEGLGADMLGINCSLGPAEIEPLARRLCAATRLPVFVKPNAGLPDPATGEFPLGPQAFCDEMARFAPMGLAAVGGCCGTTPQHLRLLAQSFSGRRARRAPAQRKSAVCSAMQALSIEGVTVIGERINPTGKPRLKQALRDGDVDYIMRQALEQTDAGAQILDVNTGLPGIDEAQAMRRTVLAIQSVTDTPLQLDAARADVLEAGLRVYHGKAIVNSVNAEPDSLRTVLPLCKKYGAAVVGLAMDASGIPETAEERFALAEAIVEAAQSYGIPLCDVFIDCLTLTVSAQPAQALETLRAVTLVKQRLGVKTVLGVSNVSFGLPRREQMNAAFLAMAIAHGLDMPILNPGSAAMMDAVAACRVLRCEDEGAAAYIARCGAPDETPAPAKAQTQPDLAQAVLRGLEQPAAQAAKEALKTGEPEALIQSVLIPALDEVGTRYEKGSIFLPQLLRSASAAQAAFAEVRRAIAARGTQAAGRGKIVLATVRGDVHDIGKNIVKALLENYGFEVIDLGRDVPEQDVVDAVRRTGAGLVGLSALMTTTLPAMENTIRLLRAAVPACRVVVGGAVLTPEYAAHIGADYYAKDAKAAVDAAKKALSGELAPGGQT